MHAPTTHTTDGLTLVEIITSLAILILLLSIGGYSLVALRTAKQLDVATDAIAAKLEEARTYAMSGKNGTSFGLAFATSSYTFWSGTSYTSSDPDNTTYPLPPGFIATSTLAGTDHTVMFARITGRADSAGTTTISKESDPSINTSIHIGTQGDIHVIK